MRRFFGFVLLVLAAALAVVAMVSRSGGQVNLDADGLARMVFMIGGLCLYLVPGVIAVARNCKASAGIFVLNLFLGWTVLGWVGAMIWAACGEKAPTAVPAV